MLLKENLPTNTSLEVKRQALPVEDGMVHLQVIHRIRFKLKPLPEQSPTWRSPMDLGIKFGKDLTQYILDTIVDKADTYKVRSILGLSMARYIEDGCHGRLIQLGMSGTTLYNRLEVTTEFTNTHTLGKRYRDMDIPITCTVHMPFYGCFMDQGRGPATKAGRTDPDTDKTEFLTQLEKWVATHSRWANDPEEKQQQEARRIWNQINREGLPPKLFLTETLQELEYSNLIDRAFDDMFSNIIEDSLNVPQTVIDRMLKKYL